MGSKRSLGRTYPTPDRSARFDRCPRHCNHTTRRCHGCALSPRSGSTAHRKRTSSFAANLARAGAKRWCQRSSDPASVPLRSCARAAASDTERGESAEPWQREALQLTCSTRPPSAPNWRGSGRGYLTSWFNSKIGSSIARTMTSTSPPITRIISGPSSPTSACSSESSSRSW